MSSRQLRWLEYLTEINPVIQYKPGTQHLLPDLLSRSINFITSSEGTDWEKEQMKDKWIVDTKKAIMNGSDTDLP